MKSGFVFYRSWLDSMSLMTEEERNELLWVILRMGLYNEEPKQMSRMVAISWSLIRTQMEVNNQRYENSIQRRQKQNESKTEAKQKQNESKTEAKQEQNESKTVAKEKVKEKEKEKEKVKVKVKEGGVDFSGYLANGGNRIAGQHSVNLCHLRLQAVHYLQAISRLLLQVAVY